VRMSEIDNHAGAEAVFHLHEHGRRRDLLVHPNGQLGLRASPAGGVVVLVLPRELRLDRLLRELLNRAPTSLRPETLGATVIPVGSTLSPAVGFRRWRRRWSAAATARGTTAASERELRLDVWPWSSHFRGPLARTIREVRQRLKGGCAHRGIAKYRSDPIWPCLPGRSRLAPEPWHSRGAGTYQHSTPQTRAGYGSGCGQNLLPAARASVRCWIGAVAAGLSAARFRGGEPRRRWEQWRSVEALWRRAISAVAALTRAEQATIVCDEYVVNFVRHRSTGSVR
jgi:hypothetical protein